MSKSTTDDVLDKKIPGLELIVFDLDYTLWPFWVDTHVSPPFKKRSDGTIVDRSNRKVKCYEEVPNVLSTLKSLGYKMAIASRTSAIQDANDLIEKFGWSSYFDYKQIYPGCKKTHFSEIKKDSRLSYDQMIFFDDESRNISDLTSVGVMSILVDDGVHFDLVKNALRKFQLRQSSSSFKK